jgi:glutamate--cysteine ligase
MNHQLLHRKIVDNCDQVGKWFRARSQNLNFPFYTSFDIRDAGFKLGPVDANIFPAGFNNICQTDRDAAIDIAKEFLDTHYGPETRRILLLTEEHTQNPYYWDNVNVLQTILKGADREVRLAIPRPLPAPLTITSASGAMLEVHTARRADRGVDIDGFEPDLIISNNDFSTDYEEWARDLTLPMNPPRELGWYRRRKDRFFKVYNQFAGEFSDLLKLDPWLLQVETEVFSHFDVDSEESRDQLAARAQELFARIKKNYANHGVEREPFLFVKNNAGTYGLGVIQVKTPEDIRAWNYKSRKKMKAAKGGREITEVIIQEGVPTTVQSEGGSTAEPVMYMIGCQLAGGFLRSHGEKDDEQSLNSPGAVFQRLCIADLSVKLEGCPMENAYGWVAKLAFLSVAQEAKELGVDFRGYKAGGPCA